MIWYLFHGRFPSEKAAAIFVMESARAYGAHMPVTVLAPWRRGRTEEALPENVTVRYVPNIDFFGVPVLGAIAFPLSYILFSVFSFLLLLTKSRSGDIVETNEVLPALLATLVSRHVVYEVHDFPEGSLWLYRKMFSRVRFVLATNEWKHSELMKRFQVPDDKIILERNGVDVGAFAPQEKDAARQKLSLPLEAKIVLYTGHLYAWKGVDTLAAAAALVPEVQFYFVGGTDYDIAEFKKKFGMQPNIHIVGFKPHSEIPLWQSAADVLVLPNTAKEEISAHYTSPMKLFEYMASARPIVASRLPSITEVLPEDAGYLVEPDSPQALASGIEQALQDPDATTRASRARKEVETYAWELRAGRLLVKFDQKNAPPWGGAQD